MTFRMVWSRVTGHRQHSRAEEISFQFPVSHWGEVELNYSKMWDVLFHGSLGNCQTAITTKKRSPLLPFPPQSAVRAGRAGWFQPDPQWAHCQPWSLQSSVSPNKRRVKRKHEKRSTDFVCKCSVCHVGLILPGVCATNTASATLTFSQPAYMEHMPGPITPRIFGGPSAYLGVKEKNIYVINSV